MPYKDYNKRKAKSKEYYYKHKVSVLQYQKERLKDKYQNDSNFRQKRQLRDKSRVGKKKIVGCCSNCYTIEDLQRHHPDYQSTNFIVLCRLCHNNLHDTLKVEEAQSMLSH